MTYPFSQCPPRAETSRVAALMSVATVGMAAKAGVIDQGSISLALTRTRIALGEGHALHLVVLEFSRQARQLAADQGELAAAGDRILWALERDRWPSASGRADLDG